MKHHGDFHDMAARITVLGSGSSGNATLLQAAGRGLLIDFGFAPRDFGVLLQSPGWVGRTSTCRYGKRPNSEVKRFIQIRITTAG